MRSCSLSTGHSAWSHHELKHLFLPFPIHTPKAPQNKIFSADFTGLENQAPDGEGGLNFSHPRGVPPYEMHWGCESRGRVGTEKGRGRAGTQRPYARAQWAGGLPSRVPTPTPPLPRLVPCLPRTTYLHLRHERKPPAVWPSFLNQGCGTWWPL